MRFRAEESLQKILQNRRKTSLDDIVSAAAKPIRRGIAASDVSDFYLIRSGGIIVSRMIRPRP